MKNRINIDGVQYLPQSLVEEALSIIAGYSEMYDNLAASPSEPTEEEKRKARALDRRWTSLTNKVYPPAKKTVLA